MNEIAEYLLESIRDEIVRMLLTKYREVEYMDDYWAGYNSAISDIQDEICLMFTPEDNK